MEIVLATHNPDKIKEIISVLPSNLKVKTFLDFKNFPEVLENGKTFQENALKKARQICLYTKLPALADDSGLEVDFLGGAPGIYSARWAGNKCTYMDNNLKLLNALKGVPFEKRTAKFKCVIALVFPDNTEKIFEGEISGYILEELKGKNGFGYDPLFYVPGFNKTLAEMEPALKNQISHRAIALKKLREYLLKINNEI